MFDLSPPGMPKDLGPLIGALDQGTSCTRFLVFVASSGELVRNLNRTYNTKYVITMVDIGIDFFSIPGYLSRFTRCNNMS